MADETADQSNKEQAVIVIRYVDYFLILLDISLTIYLQHFILYISTGIRVALSFYPIKKSRVIFPSKNQSLYLKLLSLSSP